MRINEIFLSLQGESSSAGLPTVFVRTAGCHLRCTYCDTPYAYDEGTAMPPEAVASRVTDYGVPRVCLTGGEPLLQPRNELQRLLDLLAEDELSIETGGAVSIAPYRLYPAHRWVLDVKCPASGESGAMDWSNLDALRPVDEVKFVVADAADYQWAREVIRGRGLAGRCHLLFSPVHSILAPERLAAWLLNDRLEARLQLQIHKLIWGPDRRGV